jgi:hypothetical protein
MLAHRDQAIAQALGDLARHVRPLDPGDAQKSRENA